MSNRLRPVLQWRRELRASLAALEALAGGASAAPGDAVTVAVAGARALQHSVGSAPGEAAAAASAAAALLEGGRCGF